MLYRQLKLCNDELMDADNDMGKFLTMSTAEKRAIARKAFYFHISSFGISYVKNLYVRNVNSPGMSNLDFLEQVFERELEVRKQNAIKRNRRNANLPQATLSKASLHEGIQYQLNQLEDCAWVETSQNLLITGKSSSGKTQIATHIASTAINLGYKVMYLSVDELLMIVKSKDTFQKAKLTHARVVAADMLIIDDFLYLDLKRDDLELLYKTLMGLKSTTSIVFVANREPQDWLISAEDKYATNLLINRTVFSAIKMLL